MRILLLPAAIVASLLAIAVSCEGQEPIRITFDGPPPQPPGSAYVIQRYDEAGMSFTSMNTFALVRVGSNPVPGRPDNGTAYLQTGLGGKLMFRFTNDTLFDLISVDLAEYSTGVPGARTVHFVGYRFDGSILTQDFTTDGIIDGTGPIKDFQTFYFGPEFSGLSRVEIPTCCWSLDNPVVEVAGQPRIVSIHSPFHGSLFAPGDLVALSASVSNAATTAPLRAEFFIDGQSVGVDESSPYGVNWPATPGAHVLRVTASDSLGYSVSSAGRLFFVAEPVLPLRSRWRYSNNIGADVGTAWPEPGFVDSRWLAGNGQFGFGDGDETTVLYAGSSQAPIITYYFRHRLTNDFTRFNYAAIQLLRDDGAVLYLNGQELGRFNLPAPPEPILFNTLAVTNVGVPPTSPPFTTELGEPAVDLLPVPFSALASATNVLAVEMHQSSVVWWPRFDLSFDLALFAFAYDPGAVLAIEVLNDRAIIRWPDYLEDWALEHSTDLTNWTPTATPPGTVNGFFRMTIALQAHDFFRLRQRSAQ